MNATVDYIIPKYEKMLKHLELRLLKIENQKCNCSEGLMERISQIEKKINKRQQTERINSSENKANPIVHADVEKINIKLDELNRAIVVVEEIEGSSYGLLEIHESNKRVFDMQIKKMTDTVNGCKALFDANTKYNKEIEKLLHENMQCNKKLENLFNNDNENKKKTTQ